MKKASDGGAEFRLGELLASLPPRPDADAASSWLEGMRDEDLKTLQPDFAVRLLAMAASKCIDRSSLEQAERLIGCLESEVAGGSSGYELANVQSLRGKLDLKRSNWAMAAEHFENAANLVDERAMKSKALNNAAQAWLFAGNLARAQSLYKQTLSIAEAGNIPQGIIHACLGLSSVALQLGDPMQAINWLDRAETVPKDALSGVEHGQIAMQMGIALAKTGLHDRADQCYREAEERLRAGSADTSEPHLADHLLTALETNRAVLAIRRGSPRTIAGNIAADQVATPLERPVERVNDLLVRSAQLASSREIDPALATALDALDASDAADYGEGRFQSRVYVAQLLMIEGFYEPALRFASSAVRDLERLRGSVGTEFNKIGYVEGRASVYDLVIDLCRVRAELSWESAFLDDAFGFAERAKSRAFAEQLGSRTDLPRPAAVPATLLEREARLLAELRDLNSRIRKAPGAAADFETSRLIEERTTELNEVWTLIEAYVPEYVDLRRGTPVTFEECRSMLSASANCEVSDRHA